MPQLQNCYGSIILHMQIMKNYQRLWNLKYMICKYIYAPQSPPLYYFRNLNDGLNFRCNSFQKRSNLLDAHSSENAISALSLTKEWRKCLEYLDNIKFTSVPTHAAYSHVVVAALKNNELDLGWSIFENMLGLLIILPIIEIGSFFF